MNKFKKGDRVKWEYKGKIQYGIFDGYSRAENMYAYVIFKNEGIKTCCVSNLSPAEEPERKFKKGDRVKWEHDGQVKYGVFDRYSRANDRDAYVIFKNEGLKICFVSDLSPAEEPERKFKKGDRIKWEYIGEIQYGIFCQYYEADDVFAYVTSKNEGINKICRVSALSLAEEPERKFKIGDRVKWEEYKREIQYGIFDGYDGADDMCAYIIFEDEKVEICYVSDLSPAEEPERKFKIGNRVKWEYKGESYNGIFIEYNGRKSALVQFPTGHASCEVENLTLLDRAVKLPEKEPAPQPIRKAYTRQEMIEMARVWVESVNGVLDEQLDDDKDNWYRDYGLLGCFINKNFPE